MSSCIFVHGQEIIRLMKMFDGVDALVQPTGVQGAPVKAPARREAVDIPDGPCDMLEDGSEGEAFDACSHWMYDAFAPRVPFLS